MMTGKRKIHVGDILVTNGGDELVKNVALNYGVSETLYDSMEEVA
jgi:hypothetical protein